MMIRLSCEENEAAIENERNLHASMMRDRVEKKYCKRYDMCEKIAYDLLDLAVNIAEYREYTNR